CASGSNDRARAADRSCPYLKARAHGPAPHTTCKQSDHETDQTNSRAPLQSSQRPATPMYLDRGDERFRALRLRREVSENGRRVHSQAYPKECPPPDGPRGRQVYSRPPAYRLRKQYRAEYFQA